MVLFPKLNLFLTYLLRVLLILYFIYIYVNIFYSTSFDTFQCTMYSNPPPLKSFFKTVNFMILCYISIFLRDKRIPIFSKACDPLLY